jgi:hypothetical protein
MQVALNAVGNNTKLMLERTLKTMCLIGETYGVR